MAASRLGTDSSNGSHLGGETLGFCFPLHALVTPLKIFVIRLSCVHRRVKYSLELRSTLIYYLTSHNVLYFKLENM